MVAHRLGLREGGARARDVRSLHVLRSTLRYIAHRAQKDEVNLCLFLELTVSVYEGVVVVVSAYVSLQRSVREGGRRSVPVAHNSHLTPGTEWIEQHWSGRGTIPAHTRPRPTSGPRLARRTNNWIQRGRSAAPVSRAPPSSEQSIRLQPTLQSAEPADAAPSVVARCGTAPRRQMAPLTITVTVAENFSGKRPHVLLKSRSTIDYHINSSRLEERQFYIISHIITTVLLTYWSKNMDL